MAAGDVEVSIDTPNAKQAAVFDGVNDKITISHNNSLNTTNEITLCTWVRVVSIPTSETALLVKQEGAAAFDGWRLSVSGTNGFSNFIIRHGGTNYSASSQINIADNNWHHIAGVLNGNNILFYVDGVLVNTGTAWVSGDYTNSQDLVFGDADGISLGILKGSLADVRLYNTVLTAQELLNIVNGTSTLTTGLISRWKLEDDYTDSIGDNNGTNSGTYLTLSDGAIAKVLATNLISGSEFFSIDSSANGQQIVSTVIEG